LKFCTITAFVIIFTLTASLSLIQKKQKKKDKPIGTSKFIGKTIAPIHEKWYNETTLKRDILVMAKNTDSSIKLLVLYDILLRMTDEAHALSSNEIIAELQKYGINLSRKVLPSDIALLNKYGYEVATYRKKQKYYYATQHFFDTAEVTMLNDAITASKLTARKKKSLTDKLNAMAGRHKAITDNGVIAVDSTKCANPCIIYSIDAIERAIEEKKKVSFLYFSLDENKKKVYRSNKKRYVFNPLAMIWSKDNYYLLCYDDKHDGTSRYRIDKMEEVRVENEARLEKEEFENFNAETYRKHIFSMFGGELKKVEIRFTKDMLGDVYDKFGTDFPIHLASETEFKATVEVQVSRTFFIWVVGTLGKAEIIGPNGVKADFENFINQIKENY